MTSDQIPNQVGQHGAPGMVPQNVVAPPQNMQQMAYQQAPHPGNMQSIPMMPMQPGMAPNSGKFE